ncbi:MAG: hypothetical protein R2838_12235 [Caldilineaceae bacterium]
MAFPLGPGGGGLSSLVEAAPQRLDYVTGYMLALWRRLGQHQTANGAARFLVRKDPHVLPAWVVIAATGDENDSGVGTQSAHDHGPRRQPWRCAWGWSMPAG